MDTEDVISFSQYFFDAKKSEFGLILLLEILIPLLIFFFIRAIFLLKIEKVKIKDTTAANRVKRSYILGHVAIQLLIATIIAYILVTLNKSQITDYVWNVLIAPAAGSIAAIMFDLKIFMPTEKKNPLKVVGSKDGSEKTVEKAIPAITSVQERIPQELADEDSFNNIMISCMNNLLDEIKKTDEKIDNLTNQNAEMGKMISALQEAEMKAYQVELKNLMYQCLNKGFITPQENEEIEIKYNSYINLLGGNGFIKHLYEERFVELPIHEERRGNGSSIILKS